MISSFTVNKVKNGFTLEVNEVFHAEVDEPWTTSMYVFPTTAKLKKAIATLLKEENENV